jgi:phosphoserine aminotransferase
MPKIKIPSEILPLDGRFGCGPSKLRPEQLAAFGSSGAALMGTSHRQKPVKELVNAVQTGLLELFHNPAGYEIVLGNGGSTAFWDVAAYSLGEGESQALVHGEFGAKFAKALSAPFLGEVQLQKAEPGSKGELEGRAGVKSYVYPQNETSTGVAAEVTRVPNSDSDALMFTDATSAAGGIDFDPLETDVYYFAPQKNFASDGGLWLALMSPLAIERAERIAASDRYIPEFLSLKTAIDNSRLNQTLNTPSIATLFLLNEQIRWINESGGLAWADQKTKATSKLLYDWAERTSYTTPFVADPKHRSQVVVTIDFDESVDAAAVAKVLRENKVVDVDPYRKLGRNQLRVATFTATEQSDVERLIECIDYVVARMK